MPPPTISNLDSILTGTAGRARLGFTPSVPGALAELRSLLDDGVREARLVSVVFDRLPSPDTLLSEVITNLAELALTLWPDWRRGDAAESRESGGNSSKITAISGNPQVTSGSGLADSNDWINSASRLCLNGKRPLPTRFGRPRHASELALAIGNGLLLIALCVTDEKPPPGRLLGLSRAAEWLARETSARLLVLVSDQLANSDELDGINFDPIRWSISQDLSKARSRTEWSPRIWPILGRPHPDSPGERALARWLASDEELAGLFQFNVHVRVNSGTRYLVDLLWAEGKIVVEVDGYQYHHDRGLFSRDRMRDYELLISGHLVLRLPHDEVVEDVERAVEKIRDVVRFRRAEVAPTRLAKRP